MAHLVFLLLAALLGILSAFESRASVFAGLLLVIAFASLYRFVHAKKRAIVVLLSVAAISTGVGFVRFVGGEALPGISEARGRATSKKAVSLLREILFAQDAVRRYGMIDPDRDGIGSAGRLGELSGSGPARGRHPLETPPLSFRYAPRVPTPSGPATEQEGYLVVICLPGSDPGSWVTHPMDPVDEERAERNWVAYAWPAREGLGHSAAYFINEHEEILESDNVQGTGLRLAGPRGAPPCDDALAPATKRYWHVWQGKTRRQDLPGDTSGKPN